MSKLDTNQTIHVIPMPIFQDYYVLTSRTDISRKEQAIMTYITEEEELESSATAEMESILALMEARGAASKMLRWHYRSRHDSLIAVSNDQFYKNNVELHPEVIH